MLRRWHILSVERAQCTTPYDNTAMLFATALMLTQVAAWVCYRSWPDAWHSIQRLIPDGGTLCQQEHHQLGSWLRWQWLACLGSGSCAVSGTKAYQDQLHHPL